MKEFFVAYMSAFSSHGVDVGHAVADGLETIGVESFADQIFQKLDWVNPELSGLLLDPFLELGVESDGPPVFFERVLWHTYRIRIQFGRVKVSF